MTRQEQIALLSPGYAGKFADDYADANNTVCNLCNIKPGAAMSDSAFRCLFQAFAEQVTAIELMAAATGKAKKLEALKSQIYHDETQLKRLRMHRDSGGLVIRCDHCTHYRPIGNPPIGGGCMLNKDPAFAPLVSADSFCPQIMPTRKRVKKTEVTYV